MTSCTTLTLLIITKIHWKHNMKLFILNIKTKILKTYLRIDKYICKTANINSKQKNDIARCG